MIVAIVPGVASTRSETAFPYKSFRHCDRNIASAASRPLDGGASRGLETKQTKTLTCEVK